MLESPFLQREREKYGKEAREEGEKAATRRNLITALNAKFKSEAVQTIMPMIENIDDLQQLEQLHLSAINANSPKAFVEDFTKTLFENV